MSDNLAEFETMLNSTDKPVFVMFSAGFCSPCRLIKPIFLAESKKSTKAVFVIVNMEEGNDIFMEYKISKIPIIKVFIKGIEKDQLKGSSEDSLKKFISKHCT